MSRYDSDYSVTNIFSKNMEELIKILRIRGIFCVSGQYKSFNIICHNKFTKTQT